MKKLIDDYFTLRYKYLLTCSGNILKLIKRRDLKYELVNDAYIHMLANQNKMIKVLEEGKIESVVVNWMTMQVKWSNTQFKKDWVYNDNNLTQVEFDNVEAYVIKEDDINIEDYLQEEKEIQDKLISIKKSVEDFPLDKKFLFEDIFGKGINTSGKLSEHTGISRTGCYFLIKNLKEELKNNYIKNII